MKNQKGITLIALVITIIVLLILAGVSIAMLSGENGLLNRAQQVGTESTKGNLEEAVKLVVAESFMNSTHLGTFSIADLTVAKINAQNPDLGTVVVGNAIEKDNNATPAVKVTYYEVTSDNGTTSDTSDDIKVYVTSTGAVYNNTTDLATALNITL